MINSSKARCLYKTFAPILCTRSVTLSTRFPAARTFSTCRPCRTLLQPLRTASQPLPRTASHHAPWWRSARLYTSSAQESASTSAATVKEANDSSGLTITDKAVQQLKHIAERDNEPDQMLRIMVDSGGCHGYQNKLELTNTADEDDTIFVKDGVRVVVDGISLQFIRGSKVDFVEELIGSTFQVVENPNAKHSCGCNISYDIDLDMITQN